MAKSLGVLTLDLVARVGGFEQGLDKASRAAKKKSSEISGAMSAISKSVAGVVAGSLVSTTALVKSQIDFADSVSKASKIVGMSVEDLSALNYQADLSGVSFEQLTGGMTKLSRIVDDAFNGIAAGADVFDKLGISVANADGTLRSNGDLLADLADKLAGMADGAQKTALAQDLFGESGAKLIPLLNGGRAEMAKYRAEAEAFGQVLDTRAAAQAEAFNDNLTRLQKVVSGTGNELAASLLPQLVELTDIVSSPDFQQGLKSGVTLLADIALVTADVAAGFAELVDDAGDLIKMFAGSTSELEVLEEQISDLDRSIKNSGKWVFDIRMIGPAGAVNIAKNLASNKEAMEKQRLELEKERDALVASMSGKPIADITWLEEAVAKVDADLEELQATYSKARVKGGLVADIEELEQEQARLQKLLEISREFASMPEFDFGPDSDAFDPPVRDAQQADPFATLPDSAKKYLEQLEKQKVSLGENTELSKVLFEIQSSGFDRLTDAQKELLTTRASEIDLLREQTELEKEAEATRKAATEYVVSLEQQVALMGAQTEAERALYEIEKGRFADLNAAQKEAILNQARMLDHATASAEGDAFLEQLQQQADMILLQTDYERTLYEIQKGRFAGLDESQKTAIANQAEILKGMQAQVDVEREYLELVAELRTDEEKRTDQLKERLAILDQMSSVPDAEKQETIRRSVETAFDTDPEKTSGDDFEEQRAALQAWYAEQNEMLEEFRASRADLNAQWDEQEATTRAEYEQRLTDINVKAEEHRREQLADGFSALLSVASKYYEGMEGEEAAYTRAALQLGAVLLDEKKRDSLESIWASTHAAAMGAYESLSSIPYIGPVLGATAAGAIYVAGGVAAASVMGMAHDGIDSVPQTGTWLLEKGERVTTAETSAKLDATLDRIGEGQGGGGDVVVNLIENREKAGQVNQRADPANEQGRIIDVFVANIQSDGRAAQAIQNKWGLSPRGR